MSFSYASCITAQQRYNSMSLALAYPQLHTKSVPNNCNMAADTKDSAQKTLLSDAKAHARKVQALVSKATTKCWRHSYSLPGNWVQHEIWRSANSHEEKHDGQATECMQLTHENMHGTYITAAKQAIAIDSLQFSRLTSHAYNIHVSVPIQACNMDE